MNDLIKDIRFGLRMLARQPIVTTICLLTLGLGIGASTAIFSVVDATLLTPLPFCSRSLKEMEDSLTAPWGDLFVSSVSLRCRKAKGWRWRPTP